MNTPITLFLIHIFYLIFFSKSMMHFIWYTFHLTYEHTNNIDFKTLFNFPILFTVYL